MTAREFRDLQGTCAIAALQIQAIRQRVTQEIEAAQLPQRKIIAALAKKYRAAGMRADLNYRLDVETHTLVEVTS